MKLKHNLYRQLLTLVLIIFAIIYILFAIIIPKALTPIYEKNVYLYLKDPLEVARDNFTDDKINSSIAYIYVNDNAVYSSGNLDSIIKIDANQILEKIENKSGKFTYNKKTYYYVVKEENGKKVAITDDKYIIGMKHDLLSGLMPIIIITLLLIISIVAWWSSSVADKIMKLKDKVDNLDNDDYIIKTNFKFDDELKVLSDAIDDMKFTLQKGEEYKNQMYQNISHDFKTPLTVMKSYAEAIEDGMEDEKEGLKIIKQEIEKLEIKVHSLLYLNKLTYYKDMEGFKSGNINITEVLESSIKKFKMTRPDIKWQIDILDTKTTFKGTKDMWEAIIDNILSNFIRYAEKEIKVTVKNHRIILYNDGPNIDETILNDMFTPYKKGIKGQFGLGLSIVKKTLLLLGYSVIAKNEKKGISFIIK